MEQQLADCLSGTISPDGAVRAQAERSLLSLHANPACGLALCHLVLAQEAPTDLRQGAALSLRKWIRERWSPLSESFIGFEDGRPVQSQDKAPVRQALLQTLSQPERRLRTAAAASLSIVSSSDWPDEFPELLPTIQSLLHVEGTVDETTKNRVHGALVFLTEFWSAEMDERQILGGTKDMLPLIEAVLANAEFSPSLRARCVSIFRQLLSSLYMVRDVYPDAAKSIASDVLPRWLAALDGLTGHDLAAQLCSETIPVDDRLGQMTLVNEVWRTLKIAGHFRAQFKGRQVELVQRAIEILGQLEQPFSVYYLAPDAEPLDGSSSPDESSLATLPNLLCSLVDFCAESIRGDRARSLLITEQGPTETLRAIIGRLVGFARVTNEEEEEWSSDANAFVMASDEDGVEYGLRVACADLVQDLLDAYPRPTLECLGSSVNQAASAQGWKDTEAALAVLGGVGEEVRDILSSSNSPSPLDLESVFNAAVLPNVQRRSHPLLTGRAYIFASQYASALPAEMAQQFVDAAVQALEAEDMGSAEETLIIKLSAVRCIKNFYRQLPSSLLSPFTNRIIAQLGPLLSQTTEDTLILVLETIHCVVGEDDSGDSSTAASHVSPSTFADITRAGLHTWTTRPSDYILVSVVSDLIESLAKHKAPGVAKEVVQAALPMLSGAISSAAAQDGAVAASVEEQQLPLLESAIGLAEALLKGAPAEVVTETGCVAQLCGPILTALQGSEDRDVLQNGIGALTQLVRKAPSHVEAWQGSGQSAVDHFLSLLSRLLILDSESGGLKVGDFTIALLRKMPSSILSVLPALLEAMIRRLATAKTATFAQSLILPFAFLMRDQCGTVLDLLEGMRVPTEEGGEVSGLQVLASKWAENGETIQGYWAQRLSTVALTRLLESGRPSLQTTMVQGEPIPDDSNLIRTRSRAKARPQRFTSVPLGVKALKMLLADWEHATRGPPGTFPRERDEEAEAADTDDEDDEWDDEPSSSGNAKKTQEDLFLSDLLDSNLDDLAAGLDEDDDDGDDLRDDEVYNMDMKAYLQDYFGRLAQSPQAGIWGQGLGREEQERLGAILAGGR